MKYFLMGLVGGLISYFIAAAFMEAPAPKIYQVRTQIVHDYIFRNGEKVCASHQGFHYVVAQTTIYETGPSGDYPCKETTKFRCQDGSLHSFDTGVGFCFISEHQLKESL